MVIHAHTVQLSHIPDAHLSECFVARSRYINAKGVDTILRAHLLPRRAGMFTREAC